MLPTIEIDVDRYRARGFFPHTGATGITAIKGLSAVVRIALCSMALSNIDNQAFSQERGGREGHSKIIRGGPGDSFNAVYLGLQWLHDHREPDGRWNSVKYGGKAGDQYDIGDTGLALEAFLGFGVTEEKEPGAKHDFHLSVKGALDWLTARQGDDGAFSSDNYAQGIASIGIIEAYRMGLAGRKTAAQNAVNCILSRQEEGGGWNYGDRLEGKNRNDIAITCWQWMALKGAREEELSVPDAALQNVFEYLSASIERSDDGLAAGAITYGNGDPRIEKGTPTSQAMIMAMLIEVKGMADPFVVKSADFLDELTPNIQGERVDLDYLYWGTLAMYQMGDPYWRDWSRGLHDPLMVIQVKEGDHKGSWNPEGKNDGGERGRVYATAKSCLCLEAFSKEWRRGVILSRALHPPTLDASGAKMPGAIGADIVKACGLQAEARAYGRIYFMGYGDAAMQERHQR